MARANIAATVDEPNGTLKGDWAKKHKHQSVLAQHVDFFLRPEADGILWPLDSESLFVSLFIYMQNELLMVLNGRNFQLGEDSVEWVIHSSGVLSP